MAKIAKFFIFCIVSLLVATTALAAGWNEIKSEKYGFRMLVPKGSEVEDREFGDAWGGLHAEYGVVDIWGVAKLGVQHKPKEIQQFGIRVTGVAARHWKLVKRGRDEQGWKWYRIVRAEADEGLVFGIYGTGRKGSYLLVLKTTKTDFKENRDDYSYWLDNVQLF